MPKRKIIKGNSFQKKKKSDSHPWNKVLDLEEELLKKDFSFCPSKLLSLKTQYNSEMQSFVGAFSLDPKNANITTISLDPIENSEIKTILIQRRQHISHLIDIDRLICDQPIPENYTKIAHFDSNLARKYSEINTILPKLIQHLNDIEKNNTLLARYQIQEDHIISATHQSLARVYEYLAVSIWNSKTNDENSASFEEVKEDEVKEVLLNYYKQLTWLLKEKIFCIERSIESSNVDKSLKRNFQDLDVTSNELSKVAKGNLDQTNYALINSLGALIESSQKLKQKNSNPADFFKKNAISNKLSANDSLYTPRVHPHPPIEILVYTART
ncbi:MAG: hypothetical protein V4700_03400 [Pseudomonadota bacterium]